MKVYQWPQCTVCGHVRSYRLEPILHADIDRYSTTWTTDAGEAACLCHAALVQGPGKLALFPCDIQDPPNA
jgi:hypothetical protein